MTETVSYEVLSRMVDKAITNHVNFNKYESDSDESIGAEFTKLASELQHPAIVERILKQGLNVYSIGCSQKFILLEILEMDSINFETKLKVINKFVTHGFELKYILRNKIYQQFVYEVAIFNQAEMELTNYLPHYDERNTGTEYSDALLLLGNEDLGTLIIFT